MTVVGHNSPYIGGVSYVRTWGQSGRNQFEIGHRGRNVRTWGHCRRAAAAALTVSLSQNETFETFLGGMDSNGSLSYSRFIGRDWWNVVLRPYLLPTWSAIRGS